MLPDPDALQPRRARAGRSSTRRSPPGLHSIAAANLDEDAPDEDALVCGDDETREGARARARAAGSSRGRALDAGPLASARALEGLTAVIVNLNRRYKAHAGIRVTGVSTVISSSSPCTACRRSGRTTTSPRSSSSCIELQDGDVVVVAQKAVSKAEGRVVSHRRLRGLGRRRVELAGDERDPREVEVILREAKRIVRERGPLVIAETRHGFVCASAGVDHSNAPEPGTLVLLPLDPDASARAAPRRGSRELTGADVGVIVTDSFGRPVPAGDDRRRDRRRRRAGDRSTCAARRDRIGYELRSSRVAVADEIAGAADLARGKAEGVPAVVVRGLRLEGDGTAPGDRDRARARSVR